MKMHFLDVQRNEKENPDWDLYVRMLELPELL